MLRLSHLSKRHADVVEYTGWLLHYQAAVKRFDCDLQVVVAVGQSQKGSCASTF